MLKKIFLILKSFIQTKHFSSRKQIEEYQHKHLNQFLKNLQSDFYPHSHNLNDFPIINKKIFMQNFQKINIYHISDEEAFRIAIEAEKTRNFSPKIQTPYGKITVGLSSGTSGNRGIFLLSDNELAQWVGYILKRMLPKPIFKKRKIAFFLRSNSNLYESSKSFLIQFKFFDLCVNLHSHIQTLNDYQPDILIAPASVLKFLAQAKELQINPQKIISVAEVLDEETKTILEEKFHQTIHQIYQCTEGFLAHTCEHGSLHLNEDVVLVQQEWLDHKRFVPIITDFKRSTQPIIRYRLDDILHFNPTPCPCGSVFMRLDKIEGRCDEIIKLKDIKGDDFLLFPDFLRRSILQCSKQIEEYAFCFHSKSKLLEVRFFPYTEELKNTIREKITEMFKDFQVTPLALTFSPYSRDSYAQKRIRIYTKED